VNLIFDTNGELITKCGSYSFGNDGLMQKVLSVFSNPILASQLKEMETKMKTCSITDLKKFMAIKSDSLYMSDAEMIDLFVQKASEKDYDKKTENLILSHLSSVNTSNEFQILENLNKYGKNYIDKDDLEYHTPELKKAYSRNLFTTLFYAYRTNDDRLFNEKIKEVENSTLKGEEVDKVIQDILFSYFKVSKKPEELFKIVQPNIEKQIQEYNPNAKTATSRYGISPKETLALNLNKAAYSYYETGGKDISNLNTALAWSKKSTTLILGNPAFIDTYAHLLYMIGNKVEAIVKQKQALGLAKNMYKTQLNDPEVKQYIENFEKELKKMETGNL
jgi:hypothetical protein